MSDLKYPLSNIAKITNALVLKEAKTTEISHLVFDSRKISNPESSLFFAIKGVRLDGHNYVADAYNKGVRNFVVSDQPDVEAYPEASFLKVKDPISALQLLATYHRKQFNIPVIAITGSNGKTIVKEWLYQLLESEYNIVRSPRSFNSQIGVPLSVWQINSRNNLGIFEAGISMPDEMGNLRRIIQPNIGIIINIGHAHDEGFLNVRQKVNEKLSLFTHVDVLIYCKDHQDLNEGIAAFKQRQKESATQDEDRTFQLFAWSFRSDADLRIKKVNRGSTETQIEASYQGKPISISIPFADDASIENAIHCWALMIYLGLDQELIQARMGRLAKVAMRLELKQAINQCSLINDTYNSDLESLRIALDFLNHQKQHKHKTLILSDILQSGQIEVELYTQVAELLKEKGVNRLIGIGQALSKQKAVFENGQSDFFESTDEFLKKFSSEDYRDETILLKGARSFKFERISKVLEEKIHETVLEINLNAIAENLATYQKMLDPKTKLMVMVKAFSYGSGSFEIANLLQYKRVDYLAVAYADEGVELRKAGIDLPIMVMNPEALNFDSMLAHNLEPEVYSLHMLRNFIEFLGNLSEEELSNPVKVHVKLDTGMHRLGFEPQDIKELKQLLAASRKVMVQSVFSHLSGAGEKVHDKYTEQQFKSFHQMADELIKDMEHKPMLHVLNSAGLVRFPDKQLDMVRLGLGLYGIDPAEKIQAQLKNVSKLRTSISQLKTIQAGDTVGYNRMGKAKSKMKIATVNLGYADGLSRQLSNGKGSMLVRGKKASIVGNVCMDMCMIDVSGIKGVKEGDEVIVFGQEFPVQELAKLLKAIPYEILTGISKRVKRVYYQE